MTVRLVPEGDQPQGGPSDARRPEHDERRAPAVSCHDREDEWRRRCATEAREAVGHALREAALPNRQPRGERTRCRWKGAALTDADDETERQQPTLHEKPVKMVAVAHNRLSAARTRRGPNRSA